MIKKLFHLVIVSFLSALLIFGSTAKEFVHLFAPHEDTIHHTGHICPPGEAHFEELHHHCSFLHFVLEPYENNFSVPLIHFVPTPFYAAKHCAVTAEFVPCNHIEITLRGPPVKAV